MAEPARRGINPSPRLFTEKRPRQRLERRRVNLGRTHEIDRDSGSARPPGLQFRLSEGRCVRRTTGGKAGKPLRSESRRRGRLRGLSPDRLHRARLWPVGSLRSLPAGTWGAPLPRSGPRLSGGRATADRRSHLQRREDLRGMSPCRKRVRGVRALRRREARGIADPRLQMVFRRVAGGQRSGNHGLLREMQPGDGRESLPWEDFLLFHLPAGGGAGSCPRRDPVLRTAPEGMRPGTPARTDRVLPGLPEGCGGEPSARGDHLVSPVHRGSALAPLPPH